MRLIACLLVIFVAVAAHGGAKPQTPSSPTHNTATLNTYSAVYQASYNGIPIEAHHALVATATGYELATRAKNFLGNINEKESFHLDAKGNILPDQYAYNRSILGKSRKETMAVNHQDNSSLTLRKGRQYRLDFTSGQLGPLSHQLALGQDLRNNARELSYQVIHRGHIKEYRYERVGEEQMDTALGKMKVVKVERVRDTDERETLLWLAPELDYQPVKLLQKEDGETYEMSIKSFKLTGNTP